MRDPDLKYKALAGAWLILLGLLALAAFLTACSNDAITYMHLLRPDARCEAMHTAICVVDSKAYTCVADTSGTHCDLTNVPVAPAEKP